jgi:hypothetical protein
MPDPSDGVLDMPVSLEGGTTVPEENVAVDVPDDIFQNTMTEDMNAHANQLTETVANIAHTNNIARQVGVKKFNEVGAIESAAAEVVMRIKP